METLRSVVDFLGEELRGNRESLKAAQAGCKWDALALELLLRGDDEERELRIDAACRHFVERLRWPRLPLEESFLVHERIEEAVRFGHWLCKSPVPLGKADARFWLEFLLIEYWGFLGNTYWRERTRDRNGLGGAS